MRFLAVLAVALMAGFSNGNSFGDDKTGDHDGSGTAAERLMASSKVLVIAHRGNSSVAPENTLPAFASALLADADLVELDYYHSSDGTPVVFHDKTLDRTTDAEQTLHKTGLQISSTSDADLAKLDAGSWFNRKFAGAKIPTLDESLDLIQNGSVTLIERKGGDAATCIKLLADKKLTGEVVVQAFDWSYIRECRELSPDVQLGALGSGALTTAKLDEAKSAGANMVGWSYKSLSKSNIAAAHKRGLKVFAWTVNDADAASKLISYGVDGIITDRPADIKKLVGK